MRLPRPCLDCGRLGPPGKSRCPEHERAVRRVWDRGSVLNRKRRMATGDGAAARLRQRINRQGGSECERCGDYHPAPLIRIDHRTPLASGGLDIDENVGPLCHRCHTAKTVGEQRAGYRAGS